MTLIELGINNFIFIVENVLNFHAYGYRLLSGVACEEIEGDYIFHQFPTTSH